MDFERRIRRHRDAVYRQLVRMCGNADDAEDVFVEAMVAAFRAKSGLRDEAAMQAWLVQIGRRACGRLKRKESKHAAIAIEQLSSIGIELPDTADSPEAAYFEVELKDCVQNALAQLGSIYRNAYQLVDVEGMSIVEAATKEATSEGTMKVRLFRARKHLREKIDTLIGCTGLA